jgi:hypothetical protein
VLGFPQPHYLPCPDCGESIARADHDEHVCDLDRRLDYLIVLLRDEVGAFDEQLAAWLESPEGQFAAWRAEQERG